MKVDNSYEIKLLSIFSFIYYAISAFWIVCAVVNSSIWGVFAICAFPNVMMALFWTLKLFREIKKRFTKR